MSLQTWLKSFVINMLPGQERREYGLSSSSGMFISEETALRNITVKACVSLLSETIASLPCKLYLRGDRSKSIAYDHELYYILHDQPNPEMNSLAFYESLTAHLLLWGNAYAQIDWEDATRVRALWPLLPNRMQVTRDPLTRDLVYRYSPSDGSGIVNLPSYRVLHIPGLSFDGLVGYAPITLARNAIGLAQATEEAGAKLFKNGINASGSLEVPGILKEEAFKRLKDDFNERYAGLSNTGKPIILEGGTKFNKFTINPADAQYIETRKYQRQEIASFFRVPAHMIGDLSQSTNNNIEQQALEFVTITLRPWLVRWERAINSKLLVLDDRKKYFAEFLVDGLLRGDSTARTNYYKNMIYIGAMTPNEARDKENMNPSADPNADKLWMQRNMALMEVAALSTDVTNTAPPA